MIENPKKPIPVLVSGALGRMGSEVINSVLNSSNCELVGGETAEMPGTYSGNKFDLAGFAVGLVEKQNLIKKKSVKNNDLVLAIPSSCLLYTSDAADE